MNKIERVVVMGAGPAGIGNAAALARRGYHVALFNIPQFRSTLLPIIENGGVEIEGSLGEGFVHIPIVTTDIHKAMQDAQLILISVPGYAQTTMVETCLPYLKSGNIILLMPGSAGSLEVAPILRQAGINLNDILLGETVSQPQSARFVGKAKLRIKLPATLRTAAFPGRNTSKMIDAIGDTLKLNPKPNVLDPGLNNPNFLIHPGPVVVNYAAIERDNGSLSLMNEGMTVGALRLLDAVDAEKMAIQKALGLDVVTIDELYREKGSGPHIYREKGEPFGLHDRIWDRYIEEDIPYGTVLYCSLGDLLGIPTPVCDAIVSVMSAVRQRNYWVTGRTLKKMEIEGMTREELLDYLMTGEKSASG